MKYFILFFYINVAYSFEYSIKESLKKFHNINLVSPKVCGEDQNMVTDPCAQIEAVSCSDGKKTDPTGSTVLDFSEGSIKYVNSVALDPAVQKAALGEVEVFQKSFSPKMNSCIVDFLYLNSENHLGQCQEIEDEGCQQMIRQELANFYLDSISSSRLNCASHKSSLPCKKNEFRMLIMEKPLGDPPDRPNSRTTQQKSEPIQKCFANLDNEYDQFLKTSHEVKKKVYAKVKDQFMPPEKIERAKSIFSDVRNGMLAFLEKKVADPNQRKILQDKIESVKFMSEDYNSLNCSTAGKSFDDGCSFSSAMSSNGATYRPDKNAIDACVGLFMVNDSEFFLANILSHELSHAIDPMKAESIGLGGSAYPFTTTLNACEVVKLPNEGGSNKPQDKFNNEKFADLIAAEIVPIVMEKRHPEFKEDDWIKGYANVVRGNCDTQTNHGSGNFRTRVQNYGVQPQVRERLGCKLPPPRDYCSF